MKSYKERGGMGMRRRENEERREGMEGKKRKNKRGVGGSKFEARCVGKGKKVGYI